MTRDFYYIMNMNKIEETYQKLIDTIVKFEDDNNELFKYCYGVEFTLDTGLLWWSDRTTASALKGIADAESSNMGFFHNRVSRIVFTVHAGNNESRPELRLYFQGTAKQWGWKDNMGVFSHDCYNDKDFGFKTFWFGASSYIKRNASSILFLTWVVKQLPKIKMKMEKLVEVKKQLKEEKEKYDSIVCDYAMSVMNK